MTGWLLLPSLMPPYPTRSRGLCLGLATRSDGGPGPGRIGPGRAHGSRAARRVGRAGTSGLLAEPPCDERGQTQETPRVRLEGWTRPGVGDGQQHVLEQPSEAPRRPPPIEESDLFQVHITVPRHGQGVRRRWFPGQGPGSLRRPSEAGLPHEESDEVRVERLEP